MAQVSHPVNCFSSAIDDKKRKSEYNPPTDDMGQDFGKPNVVVGILFPVIRIGSLLSDRGRQLS